MIRQTFQLGPGVGPWREKDLWARGVRSWDDFADDQVIMSERLDERTRERIAAARRALAGEDLPALAGLFPAREHWRLYGEFSDRVAFFDIETDGKEHNRPTVVSVFAAGRLHVFIQGRNLNALPSALARWPIWCTFNGACYDVPILKAHFGALEEPKVHLDLRFICRKLKLSGGLKEIEDELGLGRPAYLRTVNGLDAVWLWRRYQATSDLTALRLLAEYNLYDAFQLRSLMDVAYNRVARGLGCEVPPLPVFDRGDILYDVSRLLLSISPSREDQRALAAARAAAAELEQVRRPPRYVL